MGQILYSSAIKVAPGAANYSNVSPANTAKAVIASPVDCFVQILPFANSLPFRPSLTVSFAANPAPGSIWQAGVSVGGAPPAAVWTWVTGTPTGNQIKIGATVQDSLNNLITLLSGQSVNVTPNGSYSIVIQPPVQGQGADAGWAFVGQPYLLPGSGVVTGTGGAGAFVPANRPVEFAAAPSQRAWIMGAPGTAVSDPATGNGASVTWQSA